MYHIKKDKRSIQSSEMIFGALVELVKEKPYQSLTVTEIVQRANLGRATFYRNFDGVDDILQWKCDEAFNGLYEYLLDYYQTSSFVIVDETHAKHLLKPFLRYWYLKSFIVELVIQVEKKEIISRSFELMSERMAPHFQNYHDLIKYHYDYFIALRKGVALSILEQWIKNGKSIPPDDLSDLIAKLINLSQEFQFFL